MLLVLPLILLGNLLLASPSAQNVGYIGPACAVTEDSLFIHGIFVRKLDMAELNTFYKYQGALDVITQLHEALAVGAASVSPSSSFLFGPEVPSFCDGLDGSVEVILNGCIVRKNQVFMAGRIVRPLTLDEKAKIDLLIEAQHKMGLGMVVASQQAMMEARKRRHAQAVQKRKMRRRSRRFSESQQHQHNGTNSSSPDPLLARPQNDFTQLISHFLNINASLAQHFAPMAQSSQLLGRLNDSLIQALRNELRASRRNRRRKIENADQGTEREITNEQRRGEEHGEGNEEPESSGEVRSPISSELESDEQIEERQRQQRDSGNLTAEMKSNQSDENQTKIGSKSQSVQVGQHNATLLSGSFADSDDTGIPHLIISADGVVANHLPPPQQGQSRLPSSFATSVPTSGEPAPFIAQQQQQHWQQQMAAIQQQQQQRQSYASPPQIDQQQTPSSSNGSPAVAIRPGETIILGGQTYVAVPLSKVLPASYGLMPTGTGSVAAVGSNIGDPQQAQQYPQLHQHQHYGSYPHWTLRQQQQPQQQQQQNFVMQTPPQQLVSQSQQHSQSAVQIPVALVQHILSTYGYGTTANPLPIPDPTAAATTEYIATQAMMGGGPSKMELPNEICQVAPPY